MAKEHLGIRAEQATIDRIDAVASALSARVAPAEMTRSDAARVALDRGLDVLEVELGIAPSAKGKKPARKPAK
jgi:hypothetical protein